MTEPRPELLADIESFLDKKENSPYLMTRAEFSAAIVFITEREQSGFVETEAMRCEQLFDFHGDMTRGQIRNRVHELHAALEGK